jgi:tetratricopeptide (TPR) repeat protein
MLDNFDLVIAADTSALTAEFSLRDEHGLQLAHRQTDFKNFVASQRQALFDLRNYLRNYVEPGQQERAIAEVGVCIAEDVLGDEIFSRLWQSQSQRTLRINLVATDDSNNDLAAALARVPWEIARPAHDKPSLDQRSVLIRIVHRADKPFNRALELSQGESVRVLFIFAEAPGSRPLAARRERQQLLDLMEREVYPKRDVVAHFLSYGVTRQRLQSQIQEHGGYHIVHWSGHGNTDLLELTKAGGGRDHLSGQELLDLFVAAGGFIPQLFFLSACHSGEAHIESWNDFFVAAKQEGTNEKDASAAQPVKDALLPQAKRGYTGTAHALLKGGVPSVVAMRYSIGDDYARELAVEFYRGLLAHPQPKSAAAALTMGRRSLMAPQHPQQTRFSACDHATPVLYGVEQPSLTLRSGRSTSLSRRNRRLHRVPELTIKEHSHFVGRTWELAGLGSEFIGSSRSLEAKPVAVITGLGGMGKTALAAEALALWEAQFDWVLLYQAKPTALSLDTTLRDIHTKLNGELGRYHSHIQSNPADAIYRIPTTDFTGADRLERLTSNLIRALEDEPILLVLDNFETNLKASPQSASSVNDAAWLAQDSAWDDCIKRLAEELIGGPSRVLITSRRPLAALDGTRLHSVRLGPLPPLEAALYLREHTGLSKMVFGSDTAERELAVRLLKASRFHPLLMDRLARLATGAKTLRTQLLQSLQTLEGSGDYSKLPALFEDNRGGASEVEYLNDALALSIDRLIEHAAPDARRLLWMIALAVDPVTQALVEQVWGGLNSTLGPQPSSATLLALQRYLRAVGLTTEERIDPDDDNCNLTCHELVRERIRFWMQTHPSDRGELTEDAVRIGYGSGLAAAYIAYRVKNVRVAIEAGRRALIYYAMAGAYEELSRFAVGVVNTTSDLRILDELIHYLDRAARSAPPGPGGWKCKLALADALDNSGRTGESLPIYEEAAISARAAGEAGGTEATYAWRDYSSIVGNWAVALQRIGRLDLSRQRQIERSEALKRGNAPEVYVVNSELGVLALDVSQGNAREALPQIELRLEKMEGWWHRARNGEQLREAPDTALLGSLFCDALFKAREAHTSLHDWESSLRRTESLLEVKRALNHPINELAWEWLNSGQLLTQLGRYAEAQARLEPCLQIFEQELQSLARTYHALADLFHKKGDLAQGILQARRAHAIFETLPAADDRIASHSNLAIYLRESGNFDEATRHLLAALIYAVIGNFTPRFEGIVANYCMALNSDPDRAIVRLADLLSDPGFRVLKDWFAEHQADITEIQTAVDEFERMIHTIRINSDGRSP